jgi:hypothetical protein
MLFNRLTVAAALVLSVGAAAVAGPPAPLQQMSGSAQGVVVGGPGAPPPGARPGNNYPVLNAPLYPSPVQYTPPWTGGTIITNQALAPHEMLYPHRYHAMYGPFYYNVRGCWVVTPFGVRQYEKWRLEGTQVKVDYHPHFRLFSGYHPPVSH